MIDRLNAALTGRYAIQRELGRGGMATVFLADDVRHGRQVAIKVLHPELAAVLGAERFLKEIEIAAGLTHPHILPMHDSGQADELLYYVMPFVEGESLRERLNRETQLSLEDTIAIATDVADGLSYAHARSVVHRDIKPANILFSGGHALIADFGIARAVTEAGGTRLTETGLSLGTPHYMSPEQASGSSDVDGRSDVYALGCVTYEMLVGEPPFSGPNAQAIMAKVLTQPAPSVREGRDTVPPALEAAVHKALARLPADRYSTADSFGSALSQSLDMASGSLFPAVSAGRPADRRWKALAIAMSAVAVAAIGVAALWSPWRSSPAPEGEAVYRFPIPVEPPPLITHPHGPAFALSPDASTLAYVAGDGDHGQLYLRPLDAIEASPVAGANRASNPFFSPDGEWLGYVADGQLFKVRLADGTRVTIGDAPGTQGVSWGVDGTIVFGSEEGGGLSRVSAEGGATEVLLQPDVPNETYLVNPVFLPDGDGILFTAVGASLQPRGISVVSLRTGERKPLIEGAANVRYMAPGYAVYAKDGGLSAIRFDPDSRATVGSPVKVVQDAIGSYWHPHIAHFDISDDGTLVYLAGAMELPSLVWVDRTGQTESIPIPDRRSGLGHMGPRVSPDGTRIAFWSSDPTEQSTALNGDVWLLDLTRGTLSRLPSDSLERFWVLWDPRSGNLIFTAGNVAQGNVALFTQPADGTTASTRLTTVEGTLWQQPYSVTADGSTLFFQQSDQGQNFDIWVLPREDGAEPRPFLSSPADELHPAISPDGRWLAYVSTSSAQQEVYLTDVPEQRNRWLVSAGGGTGPAWAADGRELYYVQEVEGQMSMVAVSFENGSTPRLGRPETLFRGDFAVPIRFGRTYDVSRDGERFLMIRQPGQGGAPDRLTVAVNWIEEVNRAVGP